MSKGRVILNKERFALTIDRLCHQLIEKYDMFDNTCLIGIQEGGVPLSERIHARLKEILDIPTIQYGKLDITFYRDDFRIREKPLKPSKTDLLFSLDEQNVVLMDDVVYTGRTIQAAMTALNDFGRPRQVELVAMVDRRFNRHLPIQSNYIGLTMDALDQAYVKVEWAEKEGEDKILMFSKEHLKNKL